MTAPLREAASMGAASTSNGRHGRRVARPVISMYRQIADQLRGQIQTGQLKPGDRLPAETALAARYRTSRATVAHAYRLLRADGLIVTEKGAGSVVRPGLFARPAMPAGTPDRPGPVSGQVFRCGHARGSRVLVGRVLDEVAAEVNGLAGGWGLAAMVAIRTDWREVGLYQAGLRVDRLRRDGVFPASRDGLVELAAVAVAMLARLDQAETEAETEAEGGGR